MFLSQESKSGDLSSYANLGISLATAITNRTFCTALYNARTGTDICDAFDLYTNELKVLPGDFNTNLNKIEPPANTNEKKMADEMEEIDEDRRYCD